MKASKYILKKKSNENFIAQMFNIYIKRAMEIYGVTHTRSIYETAIEVLPNDQARLVNNFNYHFCYTFTIQNI